MVQSAAPTVSAYLAELSPERRKVIAKVRDTIRRNLPPGYVEEMGFGMITYVVPLTRYPKTYNGHPLMYTALAAQKNNFALYLCWAYMDESRAAALRDAFAQAGKRLDMGKSCLRFKQLDDLPLEALGTLIAGMSVTDLLSRYEAGRAGR